MRSSLPAVIEKSEPNPLEHVELVMLAREIAMGIHSIPTILKRRGLTDGQYASIQATTFFIKVLENETKAWESTLNTENRTRLKAAALFEDWLPTLYVRLQNQHEKLSEVVEGGKLVARVAGIGEKDAKEQGAPGEKFQITINLGEDAKLKFEQTIEQTRPLQQFPEGESENPTIPAILEGLGEHSPK